MAKSAAARETGFDYLDLIGVRALNLRDLLRVIARGLPYDATERLERAIGLDVEALISIPRRTLTRRKHEGRYTPEESDRIVTAARLVSRTLDLFDGNAAAARAWLTETQTALGGVAPIELARTETGTREVENLIGRLEYGVFS